GYHTSLITFFLFSATATTAIYTLSLHDALPISHSRRRRRAGRQLRDGHRRNRAAHCPARQRAPKGSNRLCREESLIGRHSAGRGDRKSTRLNSSHVSISYAVFCLKKKNITYNNR